MLLHIIALFVSLIHGGGIAPGLPVSHVVNPADSAGGYVKSADSAGGYVKKG